MTCISSSTTWIGLNMTINKIYIYIHDLYLILFRHVIPYMSQYWTPYKNYKHIYITTPYPSLKIQTISFKISFVADKRDVLIKS